MVARDIGPHPQMQRRLENMEKSSDRREKINQKFESTVGSLWYMGLLAWCCFGIKNCQVKLHAIYLRDNCAYNITEILVNPKKNASSL